MNTKKLEVEKNLLIEEVESVLEQCNDQNKPQVFKDICEGIIKNLREEIDSTKISIGFGSEFCQNLRYIFEDELLRKDTLENDDLFQEAQSMVRAVYTLLRNKLIDQPQSEKEEKEKQKQKEALFLAVEELVNHEEVDINTLISKMDALQQFLGLSDMYFFQQFTGQVNTKYDGWKAKRTQKGICEMIRININTIKQDYEIPNKITPFFSKELMALLNLLEEDKAIRRSIFLRKAEAIEKKINIPKTLFIEKVLGISTTMYYGLVKSEDTFISCEQVKTLRTKFQTFVNFYNLETKNDSE